MTRTLDVQTINTVAETFLHHGTPETVEIGEQIKLLIRKHEEYKNLVLKHGPFKKGE